MEEIEFNHPKQNNLDVWVMKSGEKMLIEKDNGKGWIQGKTVSLESMR